MKKGTLLTIVSISASIWASNLCYAADEIRINGSGSALDLMKPLIKAYQETNRNVRFKMEKPLGSSGAVNALLAGALDIAVSSKQLKPEEAAKGALLKKYGKTPLAIVAEKSVPKTDITTKELEDIYSGRMTRWSNNERIRLVLRPEQDIDTKILRSLSPGVNKALDASHLRHGMLTAVTDPEAYALIAKTPGGLGASGLTSVLVEKLQLKILTLNGVEPTPHTLASKAYPLAKDIDFIVTPRTSPAALKFIDFAYSAQGRAIAQKAGVLVAAGSE